MYRFCTQLGWTASQMQYSIYCLTKIEQNHADHWHLQLLFSASLWCVLYLPVVRYVHGSIAHTQVRPVEVLEDDDFATGFRHGWHKSAVPQHVPVSIAVDVIHHSAVNVARLTELLPDTHQHGFTWVLLKKICDALQHVAKVSPLIRHPVMKGEVPVDVAETDVQKSDAGSELGGQAPGLAFGVHPAVHGHGIVGPRHGDLRQRLIIRDAGHPGWVEEFGVGRVIVVGPLYGTKTYTNDSKPRWSQSEDSDGKYTCKHHCYVRKMFFAKEVYSPQYHHCPK